MPDPQLVLPDDEPAASRSVDELMDAYAPREKRGVVESAARGVAQGITANFADEISGGLEAAFTSKTYKQARDESRAAYGEAQKDNPLAYGAGEIGGGLAGVLLPGSGLAIRGAGLAANAVRGAAYGAASALGGSETEAAERPGDLLEEAGQGALGGAVAGGVGHLATRGLAAILAPARKAAGKVFERAGKEADVYATERLAAAQGKGEEAFRKEAEQFAPLLEKEPANRQTAAAGGEGATAAADKHLTDSAWERLLKEGSNANKAKVIGKQGVNEAKMKAVLAEDRELRAAIDDGREPGVSYGKPQAGKGPDAALEVLAKRIEAEGAKADKVYEAAEKAGVKAAPAAAAPAPAPAAGPSDRDSLFAAARRVNAPGAEAEIARGLPEDAGRQSLFEAARKVDIGVNAGAAATKAEATAAAPAARKVRLGTRTVDPSELLDVRSFGERIAPTSEVRMDSIRKAFDTKSARGERIVDQLREPIVAVSPRGRMEVEDGRHRILVARERGEKLKVKFVRGSKNMDSKDFPWAGAEAPSASPVAAPAMTASAGAEVRGVRLPAVLSAMKGLEEDYRRLSSTRGMADAVKGEIDGIRKAYHGQGSIPFRQVRQEASNWQSSGYNANPMFAIPAQKQMQRDIGNVWRTALHEEIESLGAKDPALASLLPDLKASNQRMSAMLGIEKILTEWSTRLHSRAPTMGEMTLSPLRAIRQAVEEKGVELGRAALGNVAAAAARRGGAAAGGAPAAAVARLMQAARTGALTTQAIREAAAAGVPPEVIEQVKKMAGGSAHP
jgi:hypothetical protein